MPKNESKSLGDWGRGGNDPQDVLGEELLFRKNPYRGAKKLGAGSRLSGGNDEDFWMGLIQTSYHPASLSAELKWEHGGSDKIIRKAARVPYLVKDEEKQLALDHLLIGYIDPTGTNATAPTQDWGPNNPDSDVGRLGRLIMVELYPGKNSFGKSFPSTSWPNVFDEDPANYTPGVDPAIWEFRGNKCRVEKSILISYAAHMGGTSYKVATVLVGYEGSGGW